MSAFELEQICNEPGALFARYCEDTMGEEPGDHLRELFDRALSIYEKEASGI